MNKPKIKSIAIAYATSNEKPKAQALSTQLNLPCLSFAACLTSLKSNQPLYQFLLVLSADGLSLGVAPFKPGYLLNINFLSKQWAYRLAQARPKNELLVRALGIKSNAQSRILDATAGLGGDSFLLAKLGYEITLTERCPIIYQLLKDALERANSRYHPMIKKMQLIESDARSIIKNRERLFDIIYLDPMFPERKKTASVKKEMRILQDFQQEEARQNLPDEADDLLKTACLYARERVVIKRPRLYPVLTAKPNFSFTGKSCRFDVYLTPPKDK